MKRTVGILAGVLIAVTPKLVLAQPAVPVRVANSPQNPVPVVTEGTTTIAGSVTVTALPAVQVAGTPTVQVVAIPQVQLAPNQFIGVASLPKVELAGTPAVQVVALPQVQLVSGTTVTIANQPGAGQRYAETVHAFSRTTAVPSGKRLILTPPARADRPQGGRLRQCLQHDRLRHQLRNLPADVPGYLCIWHRYPHDVAAD